MPWFAPDVPCFLPSARSRSPGLRSDERSLASASRHHRSKRTRHSRQTRREASLRVSLFRPVPLAGKTQGAQGFRTVGQLLCSFCRCQRKIFDEQGKIDAVLLGSREFTFSWRSSDQLQRAFPLIRGHVLPINRLTFTKGCSIACAVPQINCALL